MSKLPRDVSTRRHDNEVVPLPNIHPATTLLKRFPGGLVNHPALSFSSLLKGYIILFPYVAQSTFTTTSVDMWCAVSGVAWANCYIGFYTQKGVLVASSSAIPTPVLQTQITVPIAANLVQGNTYWIALQIGSGTTTAGSMISMNFVNDFATVPALGVDTVNTSIATAAGTFNSTLPADLSTTAFLKSGFAYFMGII